MLKSISRLHDLAPCAKAEAKLVHFEHILEGHRVWQVRGLDGGDRLVATGEAEVRGVSGVCCRGWGEGREWGVLREREGF